MISGNVLGCIAAGNRVVSFEGAFLGGFQVDNSPYSGSVTLDANPEDFAYLILANGQVGTSITGATLSGVSGYSFSALKSGSQDAVAAFMIYPGQITVGGSQTLEITFTGTAYRMTAAVYKLSGVDILSLLFEATRAGTTAFSINPTVPVFAAASYANEGSVMFITTDLDTTDIAEAIVETTFRSQVDSNSEIFGPGTLTASITNGTRQMGQLVGVGGGVLEPVSGVYPEGERLRLTVGPSYAFLASRNYNAIFRSPTGVEIDRLRYAGGETFSTNAGGDKVFDDNPSTAFLASGTTNCVYGLCNFSQIYPGGAIVEIGSFQTDVTSGFLSSRPIWKILESYNAGAWTREQWFSDIPQTPLVEGIDFHVLPKKQTNVAQYNGWGPCMFGLTASTSAFATKGSVFTAEEEMVVEAVTVYLATAGDQEVFVATMTDNGATVTFDTIEARKSFTGVAGWNLIKLDTPVTIANGQLWGIGHTLTSAAADTTSSGLYFGTQGQAITKNILFSTNGGFRYTSRNVLAGDTSTDKNTAMWGTGFAARGTTAKSPLLGVTERYWRFTGVDASGSNNMGHVALYLMDANGMIIPMKGGFTGSPGGSSTFRPFAGFPGGGPFYQNVNSLTLTMDFVDSITPEYVRVIAGGAGEQTPTDWVLESSPDNSTWTTRYEVYGESVFADYEARVYPLS